MIPTITNPQDMEIPPPPAGKVWHVNNGVITQKDKQDKRHDQCHTCKRQ